KLGFLENEDGTPFDAEDVAEVRQHAREVSETLLLEGLAPATWSRASSTATNRFRHEMLTLCPRLSLCANNWKVDAVATEVYSQWSRRRKEDIAASKLKPKKRKLDPEDSENDELSSKRQKQDSTSEAKEKRKKKKKKSSAALTTRMFSFFYRYLCFLHATGFFHDGLLSESNLYDSL
ncbi:hypothetical protein B0H17DRAFT_957400, partial [Mycena rosella]